MGGLNLERALLYMIAYAQELTCLLYSCNMMGHSNGMVDYVWTQSTGAMQLWANRGKGTITDSDPDGYWDYQVSRFSFPLLSSMRMRS